ncbi:MAG: tetratricopeptide repeat protein, partial [Bacteroidota bacterium]
KCSYKYWGFMLQNNFEEISNINPLYNFNMINHNLGFNNEPNMTAITNSNFDYTKVIFYDDKDYKLFSSWEGYFNGLDLKKNDKGLYSNDVGNSNNSLLLIFLVKSMDFKNSELNELFNAFNLNFKECTYNNGEFNYYSHEYGKILELLNNDSSSSLIKKEKDYIKLLYSVFPEKSPWFYSETKSDIYKDKIKQCDANWFKVYEIKRNLIITSSYLLSILNDLEFNNLNSSLLKNWFNQKMDANKLKAYYQNEYMLKLGKTESNIWAADLEYIESIINQLKLIKSLIKEDIKSFQTSLTKVNTIEEFDKFIQTTTSKNLANVDELIISENLSETYVRGIFSKYKEGSKSSSGMNDLGWRCLINNHLEYAEKYLSEGLKLEKNSAMITTNLGHVQLFKGDIKKAIKLYTKFPLDQEVPELKMSVRSSIKIDFEYFIKAGKDPKIFESVVKELGL